MANNYYDANGVLVLDQVTPVITALFGRLKLNASYPGDGQAYISLIYDESCPSWDTICEDLATLAMSLGLSMPDEQTPSLDQVLEVLSQHFGADQDEELENLIEHHPFEDAISLDALFLIATRFNDGHSLKEIRMEGCWHSSKPRLFEFGGDGYFLSRECEVYRTSGQSLRLGNDLRKALLVNDLDGAADVLVRETQCLLAGVNDGAQRAQLKQRLSDLLR
ncbi:hypothetical protein DYL61_16855 [Pseudomonas nabeulensis]|uniref:Uncharacterized protein n=2 Tax=Pseudomonas TaxID=286 RepID=A0A4Z0B3J6_9PSED|nr:MULTISPECIES: hypothetical protein [Pseudomonas]MQT88098.1 hypothetical protein [Pseudomonas helleri]TFY92894.1 hypothetical protein DYL61_16855 [Pseudomonas nabeulensis]